MRNFFGIPNDGEWRRFLNRCREATRGTVRFADKALLQIRQRETSRAFGPQVQEAGPPKVLHASRRKSGFSLIELMVVVTILGVLVASAAPSFRRSIEQSRADVAVANLRTIWTAQRVYWLEHREFTDVWSELEASGMSLIDPMIMSDNNKYYEYSITDAGETTFTATATRKTGGGWSGSFTINQTGSITGSITSGGSSIGVGFQD
ncbi:MAG TPA: prepilin-type cleavage/methylation domain-containing protein [Planctomycetaceae bacterium]|nr:prepilin-type cleavage/methylation domain-containing protein [Planctomycetaceae bacterium]